MIDDSSQARGFIAGVIAIGIVTLAAALFFFTPSQASLAVLTGLLSALTLALGAVVQFYFGSSSGAKTLVAAQNQTMDTLAKAVATSTPAGNALASAAPTGTAADPVAVTEVPTPDAPETRPFDIAPHADEPLSRVDIRIPVPKAEPLPSPAMPIDPKALMSLVREYLAQQPAKDK